MNDNLRADEEWVKGGKDEGRDGGGGGGGEGKNGCGLSWQRERRTINACRDVTNPPELKR